MVLDRPIQARRQRGKQWKRIYSDGARGAGNHGISKRLRASATPLSKERFDAFLTPPQTAVQEHTHGRK